MSVNGTFTYYASTLLISLWGCLAQVNATEKNDVKTTNSQVDIKLVSEAFGHLIGRNLNSPEFAFDLDSIVQGMRNAVEGKEPPLSDEEYTEIMSNIQENAFNELSDKNLCDAEKFLHENSANGNVIEIEKNKLQYIVLRQGEGELVDQNHTPLIHYRGCFLDGTLFGSSEEQGEPIAIPLDETIPGFSQGMIGMKEGEKRRIFIHPDLAYGTTGNLPPNSLLTFDVEIIRANIDLAIPSITAELEAHNITEETLEEVL